MSEPRTCGSVVVSIQRSSAGELVEGHLSWGALVDNDLVVAPAGEWVDEEGLRVDVVVASLDREDDDGLVERIGLDRIGLLGMANARERSVALLGLAHPSRHQLIGARVPKRQVVEAIAAHDGDMWPALDELGGVSPVPDGPSDELLHQMAQWERQALRQSRRDLLVDDPELIGGFWCYLVKRFCDVDPE